MKLDFLKGLLLLLCLVVIGSWLTSPDFASKNPGVANFLGLASGPKTVSSQPVLKPNVENSNNAQLGYSNLKIVGASVSFDGSYNQIVIYIAKNSSRVNLYSYILKTSMGTFRLPAISVGAGDYVLLTSNISTDGSLARKISPNHYEIFLGQKFLSTNYETAELYSSAGALISKYLYGLAPLL